MSYLLIFSFLSILAIVLFIFIHFCLLICLTFPQLSNFYFILNPFRPLPRSFLRNCLFCFMCGEDKILSHFYSERVAVWPYLRICNAIINFLSPLLFPYFSFLIPPAPPFSLFPRQGVKKPFKLLLSLFISGQT